MRRHHSVCSVLLLLGVGLWPASAWSQEDGKPAKLESARLGNTPNVHRFGPTLLCGQPTASDFAEAKRRGVRRVVTLREKGELFWDEAAAVEKLGLEFHRLGFRAPDSLTDDLFDQARKLLSESKEKPVLLHCGSANRVGALWAAHRALDHGLELDAALREAKQVGLRNEAYQAKAVDYIRRGLAKQAQKQTP